MLTWVIYYVATHPKVERKLHVELRETFSASEEFTMKHAEKLLYVLPGFVKNSTNKLFTNKALAFKQHKVSLSPALKFFEKWQAITFVIHKICD